MNILLPTTITEAMIAEGTNIPSVDSTQGEVLWTPDGEYTIGDLRIYQGKIYYCTKQHTAVAASPAPPSDPTRWLFQEPTNRMSPFDEYLYTVARHQGEIVYKIRPGFFTGAWVGNFDAEEITFTCRKHTDGTIIKTDTFGVYRQAFGEYEYLFTQLGKLSDMSSPSYELLPDAEIEIKIKKAVPSEIAKVGTIAIGRWFSMLSPGTNCGATQYGVDVTPKTYSYFKRNDDGTYQRIVGRQAKLINATAVIDSALAPEVYATLAAIADIPVAVQINDIPKYGHLSTFGFVTGTVTSQDWATARVDIKVEGNV